jgi:hypothetical protein
MSRTVLREVAPHMVLCRDSKNGVARIEDGHRGIRRTIHPNVHGSASIAALRRQGWGEGGRIVRAHGFIYSLVSYLRDEDPEVDAILREECQCGGEHGAAT